MGSILHVTSRKHFELRNSTQGLRKSTRTEPPKSQIARTTDGTVIAKFG